MDDAQNSSSGAVRREAATAEFAEGEPVGRARDIDFAGDAASNPSASLTRGNAPNLRYFAYEFVAGMP